MSLRQVWYSFCAATLLAAATFGCIWFYIHWNDADIRMVAIHVLSDLVPFLAALAIALWAEHVTKFSHTIRVVILLGGFAWSGVWGWRDFVDIKASKADISGAINTAVNGANANTAQQIAGVRQDVDNRFTDLNKNLNSGLSGLKPPPPKFAEIVFHFSDDLHSTISMHGGVNDVFTLEFTANNPSDVAAESGDIWVYVCNDCVFAEEPSGFDKPPGLIETARHMNFARLNSGAGFGKLIIKVKPTKSFGSFHVGWRYSCERCGKMRDMQDFTVTVLSPYKVNLPLPKLN